MKPTHVVFTRNWWKHNPEWPDGREPDGYGNPRTITKAWSEEQAREICARWNATHKEGKLSRRAEYRAI